MVKHIALFIALTASPVLGQEAAIAGSVPGARLKDYPWVISTTRHISQVGVDLLEERWDAGNATLSGHSAVVVGDRYVLTLHLPQGYRLAKAEVSGEKVKIANRAETVTVRIVPTATN
ncbi:MAG: hypothetical protein ABSF26_24675 [Thermoguttaceae bacterium]|jgi:hypothetical protein